MIEELLARARAKGSDKQFIAWTSRQPSILTNRFSESLESGEGRSIPCHVRRASNAGTALKPEYAVIPMHFDEHNQQSWHGEASCLNKYRPKADGFWTDIDAKEEFDRLRILNLTRWIES